MSNHAGLLFTRQRINVFALLGLYNPADSTDWDAIRAAQLNAGRSFARFMLAAHIIAAGVVVMLAENLFPLPLMLLWWTSIAAIATTTTIRRLDSRYQNTASAPLCAIRSTLWEGLALGMAWSVAPVSLCLHPNIGAAMGLWLIVSLLMATSAIAMAALPLATISLIAVLGGALAVMLLVVTGPMLAGAAAVIAGLLATGSFLAAQSLVVIRSGEIALTDREETVSLLLNDSEEQSADWLWEIDASKRIVRASPRFAYALGHDPVSINLQPFLQILAGSDWESGHFSLGLRQLAENIKTRRAFRDLLIPVRVKDTERWWEMTASPKFDEKGGFIGFRGVGSDVTERRASADKINRMARYDMLTGLPNRLLITETLAVAMAESEKWRSRCAILMVDLDRFKVINETLGQAVGDRLLGRVAERLNAMMGAHQMAGRLGGDEFAVVVRDAANMPAIEQLGATIIDALSQPYEIDGHMLYVGASVGIALGPRDGKTTDTLIRSADLALFRSKASGGGVVHVYEPQLHVDAEERRVLEIALRHALAKGELEAHYQPVVNSETETVCGFETLLRWRSAEFGDISPSRFIQLAEEARLIAPIGEWALRAACAQAAHWPDSIGVAVNVSPEQLHDPQFVAIVASALANSGLAPARLELEVTESVFLHEGTSAMQVLERILDLGVKLSLDDFGTGYSSLGYLSRMRFSTIKIDRSFVQSAAREVPESVAIIRAVVALANSLGMASTAEGVETEEEHRMARALGCTKVQGYYFGRPVPADEARTIANRAAMILAHKAA